MPRNIQRCATLLDLREVRRDLTLATVKAMGAGTTDDWPGNLWKSVSPVLPDMTIDPDILGLLVFIAAENLDDGYPEVEDKVIPNVPAQLSGVTGWLVVAFNPQLSYDEDGCGERLVWSVRYQSWLRLESMQEAPAVRDPHGLLFGWDVVELNAMH